jgi:hypothetical protein
MSRPEHRAYYVIRPPLEPRRMLGTVIYIETPKGAGWQFNPHFQAKPSKKLWPTPEAALKGRVQNYELIAHNYGDKP